jgi:hypothetical protein
MSKRAVLRDVVTRECVRATTARRAEAGEGGGGAHWFSGGCWSSAADETPKEIDLYP